MHPFVLRELARERRSQLLALAVEREAVQHRDGPGLAARLRRRLDRPGLWASSPMRPCCPAS